MVELHVNLNCEGIKNYNSEDHSALREMHIKMRKGNTRVMAEKVRVLEADLPTPRFFSGINSLISIYV